jgi:glucan 1,3-beta-glucosidase
MNVLTYLVQQLVKVKNVVGIQILNEPNNVDGLPAFYSNAITKLRQVAPEAASFPFYIHDGFDLGRFADYISTRNDFVVVDHHSYFVFGDANDQKRPAQDLVTSLQPAKGSLSEQLLGAAAEGRRNMVVDEWSCALSQAALEGSTDPVGARQKFCTGQMESYTNATAGWSFWSKSTYCSSAVKTDDQVTRPRRAIAMSTGVSNRQLVNRFPRPFSRTPKPPSNTLPMSCLPTRPPDHPIRHT